jgi:hypothetical protein
MAKAKPLEIRPCICIHAYQDRVYGKGQRVHNLSQGGKRSTATCTVCGSKK